MVRRYVYKTAVGVSVIDGVELRSFVLVLEESCQNVPDFRNTFRHILYLDRLLIRLFV